MFFSALIYVAIAVFAGGMIFRISRWFRGSITLGADEISTGRRITSALRGAFATLFSGKIFTLVKVFILDVLLQRRILREDFLRWLMHMCLYVGFMMLFLMHALGRYISASLFDNYYSTLNPFLFLRDFFGIMVLVGAAIAVYRRFVASPPRLITKSMDTYAIVIIAVIILSGFFLEGTKMTSYKVYKRMVDTYADLSDAKEARALEAYCSEEFGISFPEEEGAPDEKNLQKGRELYEMSCVECHSNPRWAFAGYGISKVVKPFGLGMDKINLSGILWYIHLLAFLVALAYLPFSKLLHIFVSPLSLLINAAVEPERSDLANLATKQMIELDACTHCSTCSQNCSVGFLTEKIPNMRILPAEKLSSLKVLATKRELDGESLREIQEGVFLCTNCNRCTVVCPVGINLQDLWFHARETLLKRGVTEFSVFSPLSFYRGLRKDEIEGYKDPLARVEDVFQKKSAELEEGEKVLPLATDLRQRLSLSEQTSTFTVCFTCQTCTNSCPVVASYENPQEELGLLPHQIMRACALGMRGVTVGSRMLWNCLGCYQCQENCPQGVCITDVLYELKNIAIEITREEVRC